MDTRDEGDLLSEVEKDELKKKIAEQEDLKDLSGVASDKAKVMGGVLKHLVAISEEARQVLAGANFIDDDEASDAVAACVEAGRYGISDKMILDWVAAHCGVASIRQSKTQWGIQGLTHIEVSPQKDHKFGWRGQKKEEKPE